MNSTGKNILKNFILSRFINGNQEFSYAFLNGVAQMIEMKQCCKFRVSVVKNQTESFFFVLNAC